jgi:peptidoglycan/LPS O-acetylase OafA/YrhL
VTKAGPRATPSGDQPVPVGEFRSLTGLRIVAAVWVVLFHFHFSPLQRVADVAAFFGPLITQGALGVDLFFVLSGFVIAHTYLDKLGPRLRPGATARFVWARASRMWPVYVLVFNLFGLWLVARLVFSSGTFISYQSVQPVVSFGQWLQQLLMVQMWNNPFLDGASWVGPTWSLSAEWLAYVLFPVTALVFFRMRNLPVVVLALSSLALMTPIAWAYLSTGSPYYPWSWVVRVLCGFGAGVLAYLVVRRLRDGEPVRRRVSVLAAAVPLAIAVGLVAGEVAGPGRGGAVIVLFPVLVAALALADRGPVMVLAQPWAVHGGRISFSLYLVHIPIFEVWWTFLSHFDVARSHPVLAYVSAVVVLLSTLAVAAVAYRFVEEPARRRMRRVQLLTARRRAVRRPDTPTASDDRPVRARELVAAHRAAYDAVPEAEPAFVPPEPRHAASSERQPTLAAALVHAQRRRPAHRAELVAALDRAEDVRGI